MSMKGYPQKYRDPEKVRKITAALKNGARTTSEIAAEAEITRTTVLSYLWLLKRQNVVTRGKSTIVGRRGKRMIDIWIPTGQPVPEYLRQPVQVRR